MSALASAPAWARELAATFESGAQGQFVLYGNVHDRLPMGSALVNLDRYLRDELLARFEVVFSYDMGNGLTIERGGERVQKWSGFAELRQAQREPLAALQIVGRYLRYLGNLRALARDEGEHVAVIVKDIDQILPADGSGFEHGSLASMLREWASSAPFCDMPFASLLIAENLNDVEPRLAYGAQVARIKVPLPDVELLDRALQILKSAHPRAFAGDANTAQMAGALSGVSAAAIESLAKLRHHEQRALGAADWTVVKKSLVERDSGGLVEFIEPKRSLDDYHGQEPLKTWLRQDAALWREGDLRALPKGYLFCGPVGTGKTYLVECLAGEAGVPVVKLKNFRDRWVGSSEGNLEKIFRLIRALGRCMVFVDEADQTLGKRDAGSGDSGLSGRLYSMIAQEMADGGTRGQVIWILATSRPDLIEIDLKRPGRVDVKVPLLPTATQAESAALVGMLGRRYGLDLTPADLERAQSQLPIWLTPGAAEALVVKAYRHARTQKVDAGTALAFCLVDYQHPVPLDVLEYQMRLAVREATDLTFVPPSMREFARAESLSR